MIIPVTGFSLVMYHFAINLFLHMIVQWPETIHVYFNNALIGISFTGCDNFCWNRFMVISCTNHLWRASNSIYPGSRGPLRKILINIPENKHRRQETGLWSQEPRNLFPYHQIKTEFVSVRWLVLQIKNNCDWLTKSVVFQPTWNNNSDWLRKSVVSHVKGAGWKWGSVFVLHCTRGYVFFVSALRTS